MEPVRLLPVEVTEPATLVRATPLVPLVEVRVLKVALAVPVLRLSAWPVPLMPTSLRVRVPKLVPRMPEPVVLPMSRPRIGVVGPERDRVRRGGGGGEGGAGAAGGGQGAC